MSQGRLYVFNIKYSKIFWEWSLPELWVLNISAKYTTKFNTLKYSFFVVEPLAKWQHIRHVLQFSHTLEISPWGEQLGCPVLRCQQLQSWSKGFWVFFYFFHVSPFPQHKGCLLEGKLHKEVQTVSPLILQVIVSLGWSSLSDTSLQLFWLLR